MRYDVEEHGDKGRPRNGSPIFYAMLAEMASLHDKKSHDYAEDNNPYGNYHFAGMVAGMFSYSPCDAGFAGRLAEKLFRLAVLEGGQKTPQNESIADTELDIAVIAVLWMADRRDRRIKPNPLETEMLDLIKLMPDTQQNKIVNFIREMQEIRRHRDSQTQPGVPGTGPSISIEEYEREVEARRAENRGKWVCTQGAGFCNHEICRPNQTNQAVRKIEPPSHAPSGGLKSGLV